MGGIHSYVSHAVALVAKGRPRGCKTFQTCQIRKTTQTSWLLVKSPFCLPLNLIRKRNIPALAAVICYRDGQLQKGQFSCLVGSSRPLTEQMTWQRPSIKRHATFTWKKNILHGWSYFLGQRFSVGLVLKFSHQRGEGEKREVVQISSTLNLCPKK